MAAVGRNKWPSTFFLRVIVGCRRISRNHAVRCARWAESFCVPSRLSAQRLEDLVEPEPLREGVCRGAARPGSGDSGGFLTASSGWLEADAIACAEPVGDCTHGLARTLARRSKAPRFGADRGEL